MYILLCYDIFEKFVIYCEFELSSLEENRAQVIEVDKNGNHVIIEGGDAQLAKIAEARRRQRILLDEVEKSNEKIERQDAKLEKKAAIAMEKAKKNISREEERRKQMEQMKMQQQMMLMNNQPGFLPQQNHQMMMGNNPYMHPGMMKNNNFQNDAFFAAPVSDTRFDNPNNILLDDSPMVMLDRSGLPLRNPHNNQPVVGYPLLDPRSREPLVDPNGEVLFQECTAEETRRLLSGNSDNRGTQMKPAFNPAMARRASSVGAISTYMSSNNISYDMSNSGPSTIGRQQQQQQEFQPSYNNDFNSNLIQQELPAKSSPAIHFANNNSYRNNNFGEDFSEDSPGAIIVGRGPPALPRMSAVNREHGNSDRQNNLYEDEERIFEEEAALITAATAERRRSVVFDMTKNDTRAFVPVNESATMFSSANMAAPPAANNSVNEGGFFAPPPVTVGTRINYSDFDNDNNNNMNSGYSNNNHMNKNNNNYDDFENLMTERPSDVHSRPSVSALTSITKDQPHPDLARHLYAVDHNKPRFN